MDNAYSSTCSAAPLAESWMYDVFLSFRGEDTRKNFVDHLYRALDREGIYTFKDDEKLQRGEYISVELLKAIENSMIAVVVFSKHYANSSWCLEELEKIIECRKLKGQIVLPVFYDVEPTDVRGQKQSFKVAFEQHKEKLKDEMYKVNWWREALKSAAGTSGWDVPTINNGREGESIDQIVRTILSYTLFYVEENLIGMKSRIRRVKSMLGKGSNDVCMIGICGMGGLGKTTIARAVYHQILNQFEGSSFLEDVRQNGSDKKGLKSLQQKLLSETLKDKGFIVKDCVDGKFQIQRRLGRKKVLVVLDDVDSKNQLEFFASAREWFGPGSRIIITTRDQHVISNAYDKYTPEMLTKAQAMELFSRYACRENISQQVFEKISNDVVRHTGKLPLALKVFGSYFCDRDLNFWLNALKDLTIEPNEEINEILKRSYDGLYTLQQKIFLHIACFYKGRKKHDVTRILDCCGFGAVTGITLLIDKSLLSILNGCLHMHDLIEGMGRSIVRKCHPYTMVWIQEDIKDVMTTNDKLMRVEAMVETEDHDDKYSPEVFKSMKELRILQVRWEFTLSEPKYFPEQLRWLCWSIYPFQSLQITRGMTKLGGLQLTSSLIQDLRIENKAILTNLKFIDLSESWDLRIFPDISGVLNLEELNLSYCESLVEVHESVLLHKKIRNLILSFCKSLRTLPPSIHMESLQSLTLEGCESLETFPEVPMEMGTLTVLHIGGCLGISALPPSIRRFTSLVVFTMKRELFSGYSMSMLKYNQCMQVFTYFTSLRILDLANNDLVEDDFPSDVQNAWPSLEELDLSWNLMSRIPACISQLSHLKYIDLRNCINLTELHELPLLIQVLKADNCTSLEKIGDLSNTYNWLYQISLHSCPKLLKDQESESHIANLLRKSLILKCAAVNHRLSIAVPGSKIPNWFTNQRLGDVITLNLRQNQMTNISGLAVCCLFSRALLTKPIRVMIEFEASGVKKLFDMPTTYEAAKSSKCVWIAYIPIDLFQNLCHGFESENFILSFKPDITNRDRSCAGGVVKCGVRVVFKDNIKGMAETGSSVKCYDEMEVIHYAENMDLQQIRGSLPTFSMDHEKTEDRNTVKVWV